MDDTDLRDRLEIIDVCTKMHWYVDHRQWDQLDDVLAGQVSFPTLAEQQAEGFDPARHMRDREDIKAAYPALLAGLTTTHLIAGHQVELDGDRAICRAHSINVHVAATPTGQSVVTHGNEYYFELIRTAVGWRICARQTWTRWSDGDDRIHDVTAKQEAWARAVRPS